MGTVAASPEVTALLYIRHAIQQLPEDRRIAVQQAAASLRKAVTDFGDDGYIALALVGAEFAAGEIGDHV